MRLLLLKCMAEVGRPNPKGLWGVCPRTAVVKVRSRHYVPFYFCRRHEHYANDTATFEVSTKEPFDARAELAASKRLGAR